MSFRSGINHNIPWEFQFIMGGEEREVSNILVCFNFMFMEMRFNEIIGIS